MSKKFIAVRDVDEDTYRRFRTLALKREINLGKALTMAMANYLEEIKQQGPDPKKILNVKGYKVGKKVRWSEEIDEVLYSLKK